MNQERLRKMYQKLVANLDLAIIPTRFVTFAIDDFGNKISAEEFDTMTLEQRRKRIKQVGVNISVLDSEVNGDMCEVFDLYEDILFDRKTDATL